MSGMITTSSFGPRLRGFRGFGGRPLGGFLTIWSGYLCFGFEDFRFADFRFASLRLTGFRRSVFFRRWAARRWVVRRSGFRCFGSRTVTGEGMARARAGSGST